MPNTPTVNTPGVNPVVPYNTLVGKAIEAVRTEVGLNQAQMAEAIGLGQSGYSKLESGQAAMTLVQLRMIANKLNKPPSEILRRAEELADQLNANGVAVPSHKEDNKAAVLIGLGLLLALMARG